MKTSEIIEDQAVQFRVFLRSVTERSNELMRLYDIERRLSLGPQTFWATDLAFCETIKRAIRVQSRILNYDVQNTIEISRERGLI